MKCINNVLNTTKRTSKRNKRTALVLLCAMLLTGCGEAALDLTDAYDISQTVTGATAEQTPDSAGLPYFAKELCVGADLYTENEAVSDSVCGGLGLFDLTDRDILYSKNIYETLYPASLTKIMTAYLALKYGHLSDTVTVSENAVAQSPDSSVCGLEAGNTLTLEDLLYGLMLRSGNDAAVAVAEHISGSVEDFAELMNREAHALGATGTHFVNPNGLHNEEHYTTIYDLYLMFHAASNYPAFSEIIGTAYYEPDVKRTDGSANPLRWTNTNKYINGDVMAPEGVSVVGGKTGTTNAAGYCLIVDAKNEKGHRVVAVILKADSRDNLYYVMNQMLKVD